MKKTILTLSILGVVMFIPIEIMAWQKDIKVSSLKALTNKSTAGNFLKFKYKDGKLLINDEYIHPLQNEIQDLYFLALEVSQSPFTLMSELYKLSHKNNKLKKRQTLYRYIYRFNFAQVDKALEFRELLTLYIKQNSLFGI
ncbi:MAG: hypothetical protein COB42_08175 [Sulfurimonas sp.]|nr:MAG: hypothetical protein COB42_08175 [Sulfurimonas sp.]